MATLYVNNSAPSGVFCDGLVRFETLTVEEAKKLLTDQQYEHVGNQQHWPTWDAVARLVGVEGLKEAKGGRIRLGKDDQIFVAEVMGLPRETRNFTEEEIAKASFTLRLATVIEESEQK